MDDEENYNEETKKIISEEYRKATTTIQVTCYDFGDFLANTGIKYPANEVAVLLGASMASVAYEKVGVHRREFLKEVIETFEKTLTLLDEGVIPGVKQEDVVTKQQEEEFRKIAETIKQNKTLE